MVVSINVHDEILTKNQKKNNKNWAQKLMISQFTYSQRELENVKSHVYRIY